MSNCFHAVPQHDSWKFPKIGTPIKSADLMVGGKPVTSDEVVKSLELSGHYGYDCIAIHTETAVYVVKTVITP